jgi:pyruvate dehydrogenase E2 component (dihydrolipoamide acetyltransferase)
LPADIIMPKWGHTMEEGKITRWLKNEGDPVEKGEELFEVETEKITNIVEATAGGVLFQILVPAGEAAAVSAVVAIVAESGENLERSEPDRKPRAEAEADEKPSEKPAAPEPEPASKKFVRATPAARRMAREIGIGLEQIQGTGPQGRVTEKDVAGHRETAGKAPKITPLAAEMARQAGLELSEITGSGDAGKIVTEDVERALAKRAAAPLASIPYSGMRKSIGDNMHASLVNTAQLTAFTEIDVTEMVMFRDLLRKEYKNDDNIRTSFNDIFILAASRALKRFPIINSTLVGDEILLHDSVNMGIAVAVPDGLIVPVLKEADKKGLLQIAEESRELVRKARAGRLSVDEVTGGTFTITNLSMFPVDGFTPILRPPETGILGLCRVQKKPAVHNDEIAIRSMMTVSLTWDHRVVDGAPASEFLSTLGRYLEQPTLIMT